MRNNQTKLLTFWVKRLKFFGVIGISWAMMMVMHVIIFDWIYFNIVHVLYHLINIFLCRIVVRYFYNKNRLRYNRLEIIKCNSIYNIFWYIKMTCIWRTKFFFNRRHVFSLDIEHSFNLVFNHGSATLFCPVRSVKN